MNSKTLRRLAADHAALHNDNLPPNYLFPEGASTSAAADDLTQVNVLLTGPTGTPYSKGVWKLHLKIPEDYPKSPPKASFRTRIWHPNVEESSGSVCVDTLKRDWTDKVTLKDVLVTISCLLIHPNPDSALNSAAGALLQDDYQAFAKQAKLMTSIHAPIPTEIQQSVWSAKQRGEDPSIPVREETEDERPTARKTVSASSVVMKKKGPIQSIHRIEGNRSVSAPLQSISPRPIDTILAQQGDEDEEAVCKENDPSLSPSPVGPQPESPRRNILGKRPLGDLPTPTEPEAEQWALIQEDDDVIETSQENISRGSTISDGGPPLRKSPKLSERLKGVNASGRIRVEEGYSSGLVMPYVDQDEHPHQDLQGKQSIAIPPREEKENSGSQIKSKSDKESPLQEKKATVLSNLAVKKPPTNRTGSGASTSSTGSSRSKPRVGLRRL
ncbi:MAG: hypothetical protein M1814_003638 [Vezdaea aestivalis]|nr:MAG: hypothetical protein M1814_003638 [Vezdaea aestivalis]